MADFIQAGDDGACSCGLCECPGYREALELVDQGVFVSLVPHEDWDDVDVLWAQLGRRQAEAANHPAKVIRAAFAISATRTLVRAAVGD